VLSQSSLTFNTSSGSRLCAAFDPINDDTVEDSETFVFITTASNTLDSIVGVSNFSVVIEDNDGMFTRFTFDLLLFIYLSYCRP